MERREIRDLTGQELREAVAEFGEKPHRARQVYKWLWQKGVRSFDDMTDLPRPFIQTLKDNFTIYLPECADRMCARDGTEKFVWRLIDAELIESVLIREGKRRTLCVSTQVGCRFRCPFCASGRSGLKRNLQVSEIAGQLLASREFTGERITNLVFMGMGEPLDNYDNLEKAIGVINSGEGISLGARKITVSTCGVIPGIRRLMGLGLQVELSISLHAADDELRDRLVPANREYPVNELIDTCIEYRNVTGRVITFEYTLLKGQNDSLKDARALARLARRAGAKVNLISCNAFTGSAMVPPSEKKVRAFREELTVKGITATIRKSKGEEILAACGQLAGRKTPDHRSQTPERDERADTEVRP